METIGYDELKSMLLAAVGQIKANHELLSKLLQRPVFIFRLRSAFPVIIHVRQTLAFSPQAHSQTSRSGPKIAPHQ